MPYQWDITTKPAPGKSGAFCYGAGDAPMAVLSLRPNRSLPRRGFVAVIAATFVLLLLPLLAVLGNKVLWGLLPFLMGALALLWLSLQRSYKDGALVEVLRLWSDRIEINRHPPRGPDQSWSANPYWIRVEIDASGGPVENYLTLKGGDREVELGAFLAPEERVALQGELRNMLARVTRG